MCLNVWPQGAVALLGGICVRVGSGLIGESVSLWGGVLGLLCSGSAQREMRASSWLPTEECPSGLGWDQVEELLAPFR